jgi:hypothetical protein
MRFDLSGVVRGRRGIGFDSEVVGAGGTPAVRGETAPTIYIWDLEFEIDEYGVLH